MKIRLSNQLGCPEKEKMLPEHRHRGDGLCMVTYDEGTYCHPFPASSPLPNRSCQHHLCPQGHLGAGGSEGLSSQ